MTRKRACDVCYRRKIQCSIPSPESPCEWCNEHDLSCTFDREAPKKKRKRLRLSDVEALFDRVEQLESVLAEGRSNHIPLRPGPPEVERLACPSSDDGDDIIQSEPSLSPGIPPSAIESIIECSLAPISIDAQPTYLYLGQNPATSVPLAQYWYSRGIALLSDRGRQYVYSKTGQDSIFEKLRVNECQPNLQHLALPICSANEELWKLPPKGTIQKLASVIYKSSFQQGFPILDDVLFKATIEEAYGFNDGIPSPSQAKSIACVLSVLSISNYIDPAKRALPIGEGDAYAAKAQCIIGSMVTTETSVVGLQTVLTLQRYYMFTAQTQSATLLHAIACRMVCVLGGHTYQPTKYAGPEFTWAERQGSHLRRLFWLCYILDKDISLRLSQPPLLTEDHCDLTVPGTHEDYVGQQQELGETIASDLSYFRTRGNIGLCRLKEKIYRLLFSPHAFKLSDGELVIRIRQLDDDLESWRLSISPDIRPKLSIPPVRTIPTHEPCSTSDIWCAHLQLEYHHLITAIHTPVRRCGANNPDHRDLPDDLHNVIHSSCDLSLEASRSTITFLDNSPIISAEQDFSDTAFYITLAVVSLFIDILAHPQNAQSQTALHYLSSATDIIQSLSTFTSRESELKRSLELNQFIIELISLGSCAIAKAESNTPKVADVPS